MKAIETTWRGFRFRSRTEARWAVALTEAKIKFEYEAQGFELTSGLYLPDFWLPERKLWLEIKGEIPNTRERAVARDLATHTGHRVLIAVGSPDPEKPYLIRATGGGIAEEMFELPANAYRAARAERFDGKPAARSLLKPTRWW